MRSVRPASVPGFIHPFNSLSETNISLFYLMSQVICAEPEALNPPAMGQEGGGRVKFPEDAPGPCCSPLSPLASLESSETKQERSHSVNRSGEK